MDTKFKTYCQKYFDQTTWLTSKEVNECYKDFGPYRFSYSEDPSKRLNVILFPQELKVRKLEKDHFLSLIDFLKDNKFHAYIALNDLSINTHTEFLLENNFILEAEYTGVIQYYNETKLIEASRISIHEVETEADKKAFSKIYYESFEIPKDRQEEISSQYFQSEKTNQISKNYLGKLKDTNETILMGNLSVYKEFPDLLYGAGMGILHKYRGQGLAKEFLHALMQIIAKKNKNICIANLAKNSTSLPMLLALGAEKIWTHNLYEYNP